MKPGSRNYPRPGQPWGPYAITSEVARGNMGIVYRAQDSRSGREVALKVLVIRGDDPDGAERFQREARSLARLAHPGIVGVHSYGVQDGVPFLTMDFVAGTNLQKLCDERALSPARVATVVAQVARAIDHAHSRGVVHRDLKPANVLVTGDGTPRITDFGLARLDDAVALTQDGDLVGTPVFMSPEQIQGNVAAVGPPCDVWALGVMLYQLLSGLLPFRGQTVEEVGRAVLNSEPEPLRSIDPQIPEDLERICRAALLKDPEQRYRSAGELARDLEAWIQGRPVLAGRVTLGVRLRRASRELRLHPLPAALVLLALLGVAAGAFVQRRSGAIARDNAARELTKQAEDRGSAAGRALEAGGAAWGRGDLERTVAEAEGALAEVAQAAALRQRVAAARAGQPLSQLLSEAPRPEEVAAELEATPGLRELQQRAQGLRARALAQDPQTPEPQKLALELVDAFRRDHDLEAVGALLTLAEQRDLSEPALQAAELLSAVPAGEDEAGVTGFVLRTRLARLTASPSCERCAAATPSQRVWRCPFCPHACVSTPGSSCPSCGLSPSLLQAATPLGRAARFAQARLQLERGDPWGAWEALPPAGSDTRAEALLRAEAARQAGEVEACRVVLEPLLSGGGDAAALVVRARLRRDQGWPRAALADLERALAQRPTPTWRGEARLERALLEVLLARGGAEERLAALVEDPGLTVPQRLEAARLARLADPLCEARVELGAGLAPTRLLAARLEAARSSVAVGDALGRLSLPAERAQSEVEGPAPWPDATGLLAAARASAHPEAVAAAAVWLLAQAGPAAPQARQAAVRELLQPVPAALRRRHPALAEVEQLIGIREPEARREVREHPRPPGLVEGRALLARAWELFRRGGEARTRSDELLKQASRALALAGRWSPWDRALRLSRARLHLPRARPPLDLRAARAARQAALRDASAACLLDPENGRVRSLFLQAAWVDDPRRDLTPELEAWGGSALPRVERLALLHLAGFHKSEQLDWLDPEDAEHVAALRLIEELAAAAEPATPADWERPRSHRVPSGRVLDLLRLRLDPGAYPRERALLDAALLLEDPAHLARLLVDGSTPLTTEQLRELEREELRPARERRAGVSADEVRVALAIQQLRQLAAPHPAGSAPLAAARQAVERLDLLPPSRSEQALRVLAELLGQALEPSLLPDAVAHPWEGPLFACLAAAARGTPLPAETPAELRRLPGLAGLVAATSSSGGAARRGAPGGE